MSATQRLVIKAGSSLLASPDLLAPRRVFIRRLMEDVARLRAAGSEVVRCSSGAVALGLGMLGRTPDTAGLRDKQAAAACGMPLLLDAYKQAARALGFDIAQVLVTLSDLEDRKRFLNTKNTVHRLLEAGILPVVNENDTVTTEEIRVGDNDRLAAKVAQMIGARHLVILTCIDGLYDRNPEEPGARLVEEVHDVSAYIGVTGGASQLGSGGMLTKMQAANMAQNAGCTTLIGNGEADEPVTSLLGNRRPHTRCPANTKPATAWAAWLADRLHVAGSLVVSDAAAARLKQGRSSIMRGDIRSIQGLYVKGDVIHVYDEDGTELARGLTNFAAGETRVLASNPDLPPRQLLGYQTGGTIISADNLIVLEDRHLPWDSPDEGALVPVAGPGERP